jgi:hypothetical protein
MEGIVDERIFHFSFLPAYYSPTNIVFFRVEDVYSFNIKQEVI